MSDAENEESIDSEIEESNRKSEEEDRNSSYYKASVAGEIFSLMVVSSHQKPHGNE